MTAPLVSIKMITYNHAPFIVQAIEGVLQQKTNFSFELVIGEDCSTDGTREIVFEYQQKYPDIIRVITSNKNVGMKKNSLRTLRACKGKYIAFCEGDDYWQRPDKLQKQVDYMERNPTCGMVHSSYDVFHESSGKLIKDYMKYRRFDVPRRPTLVDIVTKCRVSFRIQTCTVMIRKDLYEQLVDKDPYLYQSEHFLMGDTQVWAEVASNHDVCYMQESLATYRLQNESASRSSNRSKKLRFELSHAQMILYICEKYNLSIGIRREMEAVWCRIALRLAFYELNVSLAAEAKKRKQALTWKEWIWYLGTKSFFIHHIFNIVNNFINLFRIEQIN